LFSIVRNFRRTKLSDCFNINKSKEDANVLYLLQLDQICFNGMLVAALDETPGSHIRKSVTQRNKHWCAVYTKPQREEFAEEPTSTSEPFILNNVGRMSFFSGLVEPVADARPRS
jgi:hypothetical protein